MEFHGGFSHGVLSLDRFKRGTLIDDLNIDFRLLDFKQKEFKNFTRTVFAPVTEANRGVCRDIFSCIV